MFFRLFFRSNKGFVGSLCRPGTKLSVQLKKTAPKAVFRYKYCGELTLSVHRLHADGARRTVVKHDPAGHLGEDGVILAASGTGARLETRTALTHDYRAGCYNLAGETLTAETLRVGVAPVPACT
jgi:hypothetical protein